MHTFEQRLLSAENELGNVLETIKDMQAQIAFWKGQATARGD
jgi:hypothetical protein